MNKKQVNYKKRYRKDEILIQCDTCHSERIFAYWDSELEYYIYLEDEPSACTACKAA